MRRSYSGRVVVGVIVLVTCWTSALMAQDVSVSTAPTEFHEWAAQFAGVYEFPSARHLIIVPHTELRVLSLFELKTGMVRPLERSGTDSFSYGPNVVSVTPTEGRLAFLRDSAGEIEGVRWEQRSDGAMGSSRADRLQSVSG